MHDKEIMDLLEEVHGEQAVDEFGNCLSCMESSTEWEEVLSVVNAVLRKYPVGIRIVQFTGMDDDGYFWRVENV